MTQPDPPDHQPTTVCPECGGPSREIVYGMPSEEFAEAAEASDDIVIAGCCIDVDDPDRECKVCGHQWQNPGFRDGLREHLGLGPGPGSERR